MFGGIIWSDGSFEIDGGDTNRTSCWNLDFSREVDRDVQRDLEGQKSKQLAKYIGEVHFVNLHPRADRYQPTPRTVPAAESYW